ncbi:MAG: hypothetical protein V2A69_05235 [Pseudomonadota bacterium]|jgi:hypothetical protein
MKSFDRNFLEEQAIPLEFAGTLRVLGEYHGKQELFIRQTPQVLNPLKQIAINKLPRRKRRGINPKVIQSIMGRAPY